MTEEERVMRKKIANLIEDWLLRPCNIDEDALLDIAGQIMSIPELCILHPDQRLPRNHWSNEEQGSGWGARG